MQKRLTGTSLVWCHDGKEVAFDMCCTFATWRLTWEAQDTALISEILIFNSTGRNFCMDRGLNGLCVHLDGQNWAAQAAG